MNTDTQKKKVLIVITKDDVGGAQKYVADLSTHLDLQKFSTIVLRGGKELKWLSNNVRPWLFFANDWLAVFELVRALKKEHPDIVHLNSSKAGVIGGLAVAIYKLTNPSTHKPKTVFTAHGWVFNPTNRLSQTEKFFYRMLHRISALFHDAIINVSHHDYQLALRFHIAPQKKLITILNGIDYHNLSFLDKVSARKEIVKKLITDNLQLTTDGIWIGSIGRLVKEKNYASLIEAARNVPQTFFFIIGNGEEKELLQSKIQNAGLNKRFFIVPPTGNDAKYLKAFDIFTLSSAKEGLPYTLLEAMAAGLPSVITDAGGMPEAIQNKKNGFVVPHNNPHMLASALAHLAKRKDLCDILGKESQKRGECEFNLKKMIKKTEAVYSLESKRVY